MKLSFIGLGKLGLPLATTFAKNGNYVVAIDKNEELLSKLKLGVVPWAEKDLAVNLRLATPSIEYTSTFESVIETEATIILVNTPSTLKDGSFSNEYVEQAIRSVAYELLAANKRNHLFILSSTVMPSSINSKFIPIIEEITNWSVNRDFGFCYVPDFVALGQVISDFENPDFLLIGESNSNYGHIVECLYRSIIKNNSISARLSLAEAEVCKVALNAYITTKISFANFLGLLCERLDPSINVDNVTSTIGLDKRIGTRYFKSGASYGGTCFPRDTWAFMKVSDNCGLSAFQMKSNELINDLVDQNILSKIHKIGSRRIGLLGLGFKPGTPVVTEGLALKLSNLLIGDDYELFAFDILSDSYENLKKESKNSNIYSSESIEDLCMKVDLLVICNNDMNYRNAKQFIDKIIDPWRIVN